MSGDEIALAKVVSALTRARIDYVLIGNAAAALHGAPILTQDIDVFVRDTKRTHEKIQEFARLMGGLSLTRPAEPVSRIVRAIGAEVPVDFVFALSSGRSFESVRSRAVTVAVGRHKVRVASLEDVLAAKEAAGRKKDLAAVQILKDTLRVRDSMNRKNASHRMKK